MATRQEETLDLQRISSNLQEEDILASRRSFGEVYLACRELNYEKKWQEWCHQDEDFWLEQSQRFIPEALTFLEENREILIPSGKNLSEYLSDLAEFLGTLEEYLSYNDQIIIMFRDFNGRDEILGPGGYGSLPAPSPYPTHVALTEEAKDVLAELNVRSYVGEILEYPLKFMLLRTGNYVVGNGGRVLSRTRWDGELGFRGPEATIFSSGYLALIVLINLALSYQPPLIYREEGEETPPPIADSLKTAFDKLVQQE